VLSISGALSIRLAGRSAGDATGLLVDTPSQLSCVFVYLRVFYEAAAPAKLVDRSRVLLLPHCHTTVPNAAYRIADAASSVTLLCVLCVATVGRRHMIRSVA
jgi:hypothetical protein